MNTIGTGTTSFVWRSKLREKLLQKILRTALVAEAICEVDNSGNFYIANPYGSTITPAVTAIASAGTYSVSAFSTTEDTLAVTDEIAYGEHIFGHERFWADVDLQMSRMEYHAWAVKEKIDHFVLNSLCDVATGAYTTPAGGFAQGNIATIFSQIVSKLAGYDINGAGMYIVLENTDLPGLVQAQIATGYSYADSALRNGLVTSYAGVDIYVVRSGRFVTATIGSLTATNSGHRIAGIKKVSTYAAPRSFEIMEKEVAGKTGREVAVATQIGFKAWYQKLAQTIDITVTA